MPYAQTILRCITAHTLYLQQQPSKARVVQQTQAWVKLPLLSLCQPCSLMHWHYRTLTPPGVMQQQQQQQQQKEQEQREQSKQQQQDPLQTCLHKGPPQTPFRVK